MFQNYLIKFIVFTLLLVCPIIAFSKNAKSHPYQNELLVIGALKNLYTVQATYSKRRGYGNFGTLSMLRSEDLIDVNLAAGEKYGYYFYLRKEDKSNGSLARFFVYARPKIYGKTGKRSFYMDNRCLVHGANKSGEDATENDSVIEICTPTLAHEFEKYSINGLRNLVIAQEKYKSTIGNGNYGIMSQIFNAGLMNEVVPHNFFLQIFAQTATEPSKFKAWQTPIYRQNGVRSFYIDSTGVLRGAEHQGGQASENDPIILEERSRK